MDLYINKVDGMHVEEEKGSGSVLEFALNAWVERGRRGEGEGKKSAPAMIVAWLVYLKSWGGEGMDFWRVYLMILTVRFVGLVCLSIWTIILLVTLVRLES